MRQTVTTHANFSVDLTEGSRPDGSKSKALVYTDEDTGDVDVYPISDEALAGLGKAFTEAGGGIVTASAADLAGLPKHPHG